MGLPVLPAFTLPALKAVRLVNAGRSRDPEEDRLRFAWPAPYLRFRLVLGGEGQHRRLAQLSIDIFLRKLGEELRRRQRRDRRWRPGAIQLSIAAQSRGPSPRRDATGPRRRSGRRWQTWSARRRRSAAMPYRRTRRPAPPRAPRLPDHRLTLRVPSAYRRPWFLAAAIRFFKRLAAFVGVQVRDGAADLI
jgi:hypothetical protein